MRRALFIPVTAISGFALLMLLPPSGSAQPQDRRPVTVADAIEMTQLGYSRAPDNYRSRDGVVEFSPDRSKFAFVTQRGNLKTGTVEYSLFVFQTAAVFESQNPELVATLASSSNRPAIADLHWLPDNDTIVFLGERPGETRQVYKVSCRTNKMDRLTSHPTPIVTYAINDEGNRVVYVAPPKLPAALSEEMLQHGFTVTSQNWVEIYSDRYSDFDTRMEIFVKTSVMKAARQIGGTLDLDTWVDTEVNLSPNGRYALVAGWVNDPARAWAEYKADVLSGSVSTACATGKAGNCPREYLLIDLAKETISPLIDAPLLPLNPRSLSLAAWTQRNSVLLVNALLPLDTGDPEQRRRRRANVYVAEVIPASKKIVEITARPTAFPLRYILSDGAANRVVARPLDSADGPQLEFRNDGNNWKIKELGSETNATAQGLLVTLEEDLNSPPRLVATEARTGRKNLLLDLNPQFARITFGRVEVFKWKAKDGHAVAGSLYVPPNYSATERYPLVIQTHGYTRERFWIDGPFSTGYAAQPLANKGFVVLQIDMGDPDVKDSYKDATATLNTPQEALHEVAAYEAAIDELDHRGLIDRRRVGLTGFSRTVYHVLYTLTHSRYDFGAAVVSDGGSFGYLECVLFDDTGDPNDVLPCEKINGGGPPYGGSLSGWAKAAPTFNLDKVAAPVLLQAILSPLGEWEIYAGLRWLKKPVELLDFYPAGEHVLVKPWQRMTSQETTVDWYCYWLEGEEDPAPAKAQQYQRWEKLCDMQVEQNPNQPAFCVRSTAH
jgi:dipeptidyl aminopeptidase/acylaminoacyl peptidase